MTPSQVVDYLTYRNYFFNRVRSPEISPERWARIYPNAAELEARYQQEMLEENELQNQRRINDEER